MLVDLVCALQSVHFADMNSIATRIPAAPFQPIFEDIAKVMHLFLLWVFSYISELDKYW